jgi:hypothetical protein
MSIRSISVDETPDIESRAVMFVEQLQPVSETTGDLGEKEGDVAHKANEKQSLNERMNAVVKNEAEVSADGNEALAEKSVEIPEKVGHVDMMEGSLQIENTALAEGQRANTPAAVESHSLSLELANSHTSNVSGVNGSSRIESGDVAESSPVADAASDTQETAEGLLQPASGCPDCDISTAESPTSDTQLESSSRTACSSSCISPSEETQMPADTDPVSAKAVSSPEHTGTYVTNSGDDESPCVGSSLVHTRLPPGKVWYIYLY